jgi:hypothetical protein
LGCCWCSRRPKAAIKSSSSSSRLKISPSGEFLCSWSRLRPTASLAFLYGVALDESYLNS